MAYHKLLTCTTAATLLIISYIDRASLYCTSQNLLSSLVEQTPFCVITGNITIIESMTVLLHTMRVYRCHRFLCCQQDYLAGYKPSFGDQLQCTCHGKTIVQLLNFGTIIIMAILVLLVIIICRYCLHLHPITTSYVVAVSYFCSLMEDQVPHPSSIF